jgi:hypothetical protein
MNIPYDFEADPPILRVRNLVSMRLTDHICALAQTVFRVTGKGKNVISGDEYRLLEDKLSEAHNNDSRFQSPLGFNNICRPGEKHAGIEHFMIFRLPVNTSRRNIGNVRNFEAIVALAVLIYSVRKTHIRDVERIIKDIRILKNITIPALRRSLEVSERAKRHYELSTLCEIRSQMSALRQKNGLSVPILVHVFQYIAPETCALPKAVVHID